MFINLKTYSSLLSCFLVGCGLLNFFGVKFCVVGGGSSGQNGQAGRGGWALPSTERAQHSGRVIPDARGGAGSSGAQLSGRMKSDVRDSSSYSRGRGRN